METLGGTARRGCGEGREIRVPLFLLALAASLLASLSLISDARGAEPFPQFARFCPIGTAGGECRWASGVATSPVDGHLFEADTANNRIQEFTPWGQFVKAFGWSVVASGPGNKPQNEIQQLTISATGGSFKLRYGTPGGFTVLETAAIPYQSGVGPTAAQVQSALVDASFSESSDPFGPGDLSVTGPAGGPWSLEFIGKYTDGDFGGGPYALFTKPEGLSGVGASATLTETQTGGSYEICVPADGDVCATASPGSHPGQLSEPQGIAVDSSGDVYVVDRENHRVQKYGPAGEFLLMIGGDVNQTTGEDVCTAAQVGAGDICGAGTFGNPGPGGGQFSSWTLKNLPNVGDYIDVGPDDSVYVGDAGRIQIFGTDGSFQSQISGAAAGQIVQSLDVGPEGEIYVAFVELGSPANFLSSPNVRRLTPSGIQTGQLSVPNPRGIASAPDGSVFVVDTVTVVGSRILGFNAAGAQVDLTPDSPGVGLGEGVLDEPVSLAVTSPPTCGLARTNLAVGNFNSAATKGFINFYGGAPDPDVCPQPPVPPTIAAQFATSVDTTSATLRARINPHFWPDTRYYVEYGSGKCTEGGCTQSKPVPPGALLTSDVLDADVLTNAVLLAGLAPGSTYHYRFVARSGGAIDPVTGAEATFRTARVAGEETGCPNDAFRTGPAATLPDCRAYEMVSPVDKSNGDVSRTAEFSVAQADPSGQRMTFSSLRSFADPQGAPLVSQYLGKRGSAGWTTTSISPPRSVPSLYPLGAATESNFFKALSPDLCSGWVLQDNEKLLTAGAPAGVPNLYRRDNCGGGGYQLISSSSPPGYGPIPYGTSYFPTVQGFSADSARSVFRANAALAVSPGGPRPPFSCFVESKSGSIAYRWLRNGTAIGGATQSTYTPISSDVGKSIQCQVTATESGRSSIVASESLLVMPAPATAPPNPGARPGSEPDVPGAPMIAGSPIVASTLTCEPGTWQGSPTFTYQWLRNGTGIGGATEPTYTPTALDEGSSVQCRLTGTNAGGDAVSFSRSTTIRANLPLSSAGPQITGSAEVGETLTCEPGTWQGSPTFTYQWLSDGTPIGGASGSEHTLLAADQGKAIQCQVAATNPEATVLATSSRVVPEPSPGTAPPVRLASGKLTGSAEVGETLTCEPGTWQGSPTFTYQWLSDGTPIGGASGSEHTLLAADQGKAIQCQVTASNASGAVVATDGSASDTVYAAPPAAPRAVITTHGNFQLYVSSGSELRLVSVLPNGGTTSESTTAGTAWSLAQTANSREDSTYHAVSTDATRVFWTAKPFHSPEDNGTGPGKLYLRLNAIEAQSSVSGGKCTEAAKACTIPISESPQTRFVSANPEGSRVVYMVGNANPEVGLQLYTSAIDTAGSEAVATPELIADGVRGVMGVSDDATRIYFVSRLALTSDPNGRGKVAVVGQPNLFFFEAGQPLEFVGTLAASDAVDAEVAPGALTPPSPIALSPSRRTSRVSPDGLHAAFTSISDLTGYDNADAESGEPNAEVFVYSAAAGGGVGSLVCVSCNPSGGRPTGRLIHTGIGGTADDIWAAAIIPGWNSEYQPSRALSDNGNRVFFNAYDSLVPVDGNGRADVYQWESPGEGSCTEASSSFSEDNAGCVRLISSGQSGEDAQFLDATPSGADVFFVTQAKLVGDDYGLRDVYDARVNGGFAPAAVPGPGCQGEACQNPPPPPTAAPPPSNGFVGSGNVKEKPPKRCPKGKHKAKRNGKTVCVKNKKKGKGKSRGAKGRGQARGGAR